MSVIKRVNTNVFNVNECEELMTFMEQMSSLLDNNSDKMDEGVYLCLYDTLKDLYNTKLFIKIEEYSKKSKRKYKGRNQHSQQQYRILAEQFPDKYAICPICDTGMLKENIKIHYQTTQKCRDIYYTKRGVENCKKCIDPQIKTYITEIYGEPLPELPSEFDIDSSFSHFT